MEKNKYVVTFVTGGINEEGLAEYSHSRIEVSGTIKEIETKIRSEIKDQMDYMALCFHNSKLVSFHMEEIK